MRLFFRLRALLFLFLAQVPLHAVEMDLGQYQKDSGIAVSTPEPDSVLVSWPASKAFDAGMLLDLRPGEPLIRSFTLRGHDGKQKTLATRLDPAITLTVGERDKKKAAEAFRGMVFFENPRQHPYQTYPVLLDKKKVQVSSDGPRVTIRLGDVSAGSFHGDFRFTVYRNSPLVRAEAVLSTQEELRAILYDAGVSGPSPEWKTLFWHDPLDRPRSLSVSADTSARPLGAKYRALVAEGGNGSIAVFPAPHQYFYPLDFAENFQFNWLGAGYAKMPGGFGFGIRQPPDGDRRWVPWFDAPANTEQHLAVFYLLGAGNGEQTLQEVARYTHGDAFKPLPGYKTFTSHYHIEHTLDFLDRQKREKTTGIPDELVVPGFVRKFKETGVDIVHLAEFHQGWTPSQKTADRLKMQKVMHDECARLSDKQLLLLPGEEPNVHLGGHWISLFPKPVYWVLNRSAAEPFVEEVEGYGKVYHVGSAADVLKLMEQENGLMWTAHARIKASIPFPDGYRTEPFYLSDHFLGAAWKALPANLSRPTLGWRVLDLFDDMNQWGRKKQVLGEVDVFKVEPDYELYAHMNINYLKLDHSPRFADGWQPVLDTLRRGKFFTTTGEILIPEFTVGGRPSGDTVKRLDNGQAELQARLEWTFPLAFAEVISGDGQTVRRKRIDLSDTQAFGTRTLQVSVDLKGQHWVRFEVWDIAANGAFTQPVWIDAR